jgi:Helix-turn-helix domain
MGKKMNVAEAAEYTRYSQSTLNRLRCHGGGPVYSKPAGKVIYDVDDLDAWLNGGKRQHTADTSKAA